MKMHWLKVSLLAAVAAWMIPGSASAGWRDRVERREARYEDRYEDRSEDRIGARTLAPAPAPQRTYWNGRAYVPAPPAATGPVDRLLFASPRTRSYYRRYGWPTEPPRSAVVYRPRTPSPAPRNFVEQSSEPLPALREPMLALGAASGVEQTSAEQSIVEPMPAPARQPTPAFDAQPPADMNENLAARKVWPQVRREENERWREERIKELESRIQALEAAQSGQAGQPQPLPGTAD